MKFDFFCHRSWQMSTLDLTMITSLYTSNNSIRSALFAIPFFPDEFYFSRDFLQGWGGFLSSQAIQ